MRPEILVVVDAQVPRHIVDISGYKPPKEQVRSSEYVRVLKNSLKSDLLANEPEQLCGKEAVGSHSGLQTTQGDGGREMYGFGSGSRKGASKSSIKRKRAVGHAEEVDERCANDIEEYFEQRTKQAATSDRTLAGVAIVRMDGQAVLDAIAALPPVFAKERAFLHRNLLSKFAPWLSELMCGFNIILYGFGSKKGLLDEFARTSLAEYPRLVVNGHFPTLTLRHVLSKITGNMIGYGGAFRSVGDQCDLIRAALARDPMLRIFLVIHNVDGPAFRGEKAQAVIAELASIPRFHLIASVDHINAPLIWEHSKVASIRWIWHDATTFENYSSELSYEGSLLVRPMALSPRTIAVVLRSLTPNARGIFGVLARHQLDAAGAGLDGDCADTHGLSFQEYYARCRELFLANSDLALRTQLIEFRDHAIIRSKKGADGIEYLHIPVDRFVLRQVMDQYGAGK